MKKRSKKKVLSIFGITLSLSVFLNGSGDNVKLSRHIVPGEERLAAGFKSAGYEYLFRLGERALLGLSGKNLDPIIIGARVGTFLCLADTRPGLHSFADMPNEFKEKILIVCGVSVKHHNDLFFGMKSVNDTVSIYKEIPVAELRQLFEKLGY